MRRSRRRPSTREGLATELEFEGDPKADVDFNGRPPECVRPLESDEEGGVLFGRTTFDIVLARKD